METIVKLSELMGIGGALILMIFIINFFALERVPVWILYPMLVLSILATVMILLLAIYQLMQV